MIHPSTHLWNGLQCYKSLQRSDARTDDLGHLGLAAKEDWRHEDVRVRPIYALAQISTEG
jgi:hypothetical protein